MIIKISSVFVGISLYQTDLPNDKQQLKSDLPNDKQQLKSDLP